MVLLFRLMLLHTKKRIVRGSDTYEARQHATQRRAPSHLHVSNSSALKVVVETSCIANKIGFPKTFYFFDTRYMSTICNLSKETISYLF